MYGFGFGADRLDFGLPRQEGIQFFLAGCLSKIRKFRQQQLQVGIRVQTISFRCLHQRVNNGAGIRTLGRIAEQPVFPPNRKGPDRVLNQIVGVSSSIPLISTKMDHKSELWSILYKENKKHSEHPNASRYLLSTKGAGFFNPDKRPCSPV